MDDVVAQALIAPSMVAPATYIVCLTLGLIAIAVVFRAIRSSLPGALIAYLDDAIEQTDEALNNAHNSGVFADQSWVEELRMKLIRFDIIIVFSLSKPPLITSHRFKLDATKLRAEVLPASVYPWSGYLAFFKGLSISIMVTYYRVQDL